MEKLFPIPCLFAHGIDEFFVRLGAAHLVEQEFHAVDGRHGCKDLAEDPDALEYVVGEEEIFLAGSG